MQFKTVFRFAKVFAILCLSFIVHPACGQAEMTVSNPVVPQTSNSLVLTQAKISQTAVLKGSDGEVALQLTFTPDSSLVVPEGQRKPTDFVVVLDRSGSMSDANKMDYAHKAIQFLLTQMNENDRFTLVTFDNLIEKPVIQESITSKNRQSILQKVMQVTPRGGTNLAQGLLQGVSFLKEAKVDDQRAKRLILISDGYANIGMTDPKQIGLQVKSIASGEFSVSTIGVGLDYDEHLLSNIADYGMGNYHFLKKLSDMDNILAGEFYGASQVVVQNLQLQLDVPGVELIEASGYPIEKNGSTIVLKPGHLYSKQTKVLYLTFKVPTSSVTEYSLGRATLSYHVQDRDYTTQLMSYDFKVNCLPEERKQDVTASINNEVYDQVWKNNNYGRFLDRNAENLSSGNVKAALENVKDYKGKLEQAMQNAPSSEIKKQIDEMTQIEDEIVDSQNLPEQQQYLGKTYHSLGVKTKRQ